MKVFFSCDKPIKQKLLKMVTG